MTNNQNFRGGGFPTQGSGQQGQPPQSQPWGSPGGFNQGPSGPGSAGNQWGSAPGQSAAPQFDGAGNYSSIDGGRRLQAKSEISVERNDARQGALVSRTEERARRRRRMWGYTLAALVMSALLTVLLIVIFTNFG